MEKICYTLYMIMHGTRNPKGKGQALYGVNTQNYSTAIGSYLIFQQLEYMLSSSE